jgi:hypothetical protein
LGFFFAISHLVKCDSRFCNLSIDKIQIYLWGIT